tara:strand:- start:1384 stop:2229 length:846 start_codon:yes stop_codon:yes gene_type:complete
MADLKDLKTFLEFKGLDLGTGQRGVDLMKEFKTAEDLGEEYGLNVALPSLGGLTVNQFAAENIQSMIPEGQERKIIGGKTFLIDKDRPTGPARIAAGIMDFFDPEADRDKLGGMGVVDDEGRYAYDPTGGLTEFDPKDLSQLKLNPSIQRKVQKAYKQETAGMGTPTDSISDSIEAYTKFKKAQDTQSRKSKLIDAALESAVMRANMPFITNTMKDISAYKQQQLLDAEAIKQGMPNALQARMLAGDTGFAQQAGAISSLADSATRMAGLGVFPRNVIYRV